MAGDATKARLWADADVYIGTLAAVTPTTATTAFSSDWSLVGLLDGEQGFTQTRDEETSDHYAWGGILVRTSRRNFKLSVGFTALEDNLVTRQLLWPSSPAGSLVVPRPARVKIAFETRDGSTVRRLISKYQAEVMPSGDLTENESDLARFPLTAVIYPDTTTSPATLFTEQKTVAGSS